MQRVNDIARIVKFALGILLIVAFFLPWVAQTPSCMDRSVIIRDNISGFTLVREGTAAEPLIAPLFGAVVAALALMVRGRAAPLARSLVSLAEIPAALIAAVFIDLSLRLFTPFIIRYGYVATEGLIWAIGLSSLAEVICHFGRLTKIGKRIVAGAAAALVVLASVDWLARLFG